MSVLPLRSEWKRAHPGPKHPHRCLRTHSFRATCLCLYSCMHIYVWICMYIILAYMYDHTYKYIHKHSHSTQTRFWRPKPSSKTSKETNNGDYSAWPISHACRLVRAKQLWESEIPFRLCASLHHFIAHPSQLLRAEQTSTIRSLPAAFCARLCRAITEFMAAISAWETPIENNHSVGPFTSRASNTVMNKRGH